MTETATSARRGVHVLHGYRVESDVPLYVPAADSAHDLPVIRIRRGTDRPVPWEAPSGELLARMEDRERRVYYAIARDADRLSLRFYGACEFEADLGMRDVVAHADPSIDPAVLPVLASGTVLAVRMMLDDHLVLHASAVQVDGAALAFVGASGMGKSTLATLLCAAGRALVSDDLLRCRMDPQGVTVWPGASETRLRKAALDLQAHFADNPAARTTGDGRTAISAPIVGEDPLPLAACVVPLPDRALNVPDVRRLAPMQALTSLIRFPRVLGWTDKSSSARQFEALSALVESVPVYEARLPWGPPFSPTLAADLLARLGLDGHVSDGPQR
jgi:hypothetical protein